MKQPELGKKISELRKSKGLTQEDLVEKCNISVRTIQRIEAGEVTPRSFTIKTILNALDYNFSSISNIVLKKYWRKFLTLAWVFGIIYFLIGFFEFSADYSLVVNNEMIFTKPFYILIKLIVVLSYTFFIYGFSIIGDIFKNYILKIASYILLFTLVITIGYDIVSLYNELLPQEIILTIQSVTFGMLQLVFGIGLLKLIKDIGNISLIAGILEIITGTLLLSVFLALGALFTFTIALVLEIIILYKVSEKIKL